MNGAGSPGHLAVRDSRDPLLAKYAQSVGYRRSPGLTVASASAGIGLHRILLWSAWWSTTTDLASSSRTKVLEPSTWGKDSGDLFVLSTHVR